MHMVKTWDPELDIIQRKALMKAFLFPIARNPEQTISTSAWQKSC